MPTIIDTHAHLYEFPDPASVLKDSAASGVSDVIALGVDLASNKKHIEIKGKRGGGSGERKTAGLESSSVSLPSPLFPRVHIALGLHPGNITTPVDTDACFAFMREHIREAVAVGETGLDFSYPSVRKDEAKKREQRDVFGRHLELAKEFALPVVIHSRGAWRESLEMTRAAGTAKANFHWYSGPLDVLKDILDAGFFISATPALARSPELRAAVEYAPLGRILVETDTPVRGWTPKDVWTTLKLLSEIKGQREEDVLAIVNANARGFFGIE